MDGISAYKENTVSTQSRGRLILLLYEGAIKFLKHAIAEIERQDWLKKGEYINKALDIINELNACLDMDGGGEVAMNLRKLYLFMIQQLAEANLHRDPHKIREVIGILEELHEGWATITE
jgi:flagellar protein FliS